MPADIHALLCGPQPCPFTADVPAGADGKSRMEGMFSDSMRTAAAVLYLCKHHRGPLDVLTASIDLGGDVDSIAALCLGIVAASDDLHFGRPGGLSWRLLEELEGVEYLMAHAKAFEAWLAQQPPPPDDDDDVRPPAAPHAAEAEAAEPTAEGTAAAPSVAAQRAPAWVLLGAAGAALAAVALIALSARRQRT
eukprot:2641407-Prymnesium_polylepis.1